MSVRPRTPASAIVSPEPEWFTPVPYPSGWAGPITLEPHLSFSDAVLATNVHGSGDKSLKDMPKEEVEKAALSHEAVVRALNGAVPKKVIVVPGRLINFVVR